MITNEPLVSIVIITYNSSKYVIDTLESAKEQTYLNIELIISDDCSSDNTVEICRNWINVNKNRFVRIELLTVDINTGIPANCNRGLKIAKGEWIKFIAGDDALFSYALEEVIKFLLLNKEIEVLETGTIVYNNELNDRNIERRICPPEWFFSKKMNYKKQYKLLLIKGLLHAPSMFYKRELLIKIGGFDERFKLLEDTPLWVNITKSKNKIYYYNLNTVKYRLHKSSVSTYTPEKKIFRDFYKTVYYYTKTVIFPEINFIIKLIFFLDYYFQFLYDKYDLNNKDIKVAYYIFKVWQHVNPLRLLISYKKNYYKYLSKF